MKDLIFKTEEDDGGRTGRKNDCINLSKAKQAILKDKT